MKTLWISRAATSVCPLRLRLIIQRCSACRRVRFDAGNMSEPQVAGRTVQVPEWEHEHATHFAPPAEKSPHHTIQGLTTESFANSRRRFQARFDTTLPPTRKYLGLRRKWFLIGVVCTFLALLVLIIGLAAGLSHKRSQNLPLPSNSKTFSGDLTYYDPGLGACGITSSSSDKIVAVSHLVFDAAQSGSDPNSNPLCGKKIRATRFNDAVNAQRSVDLTVVDRCVGCKATDIDVTLSAFTELAPEADGRVKVTWAWLS
ncbi:hypothetical protein ANO11243_063170 [Dothideomycetidae sp. 11243]|nr:hypothetical protein ANO11243_063170 [fungal sp. No.11243]